MRKNHNIFFIVGILTLVLLFFISCDSFPNLEYVCEDSLATADYFPGGFMTQASWALTFESGMIIKLIPYAKMPELNIGRQYEVYKWPAGTKFAGKPIYRIFIKEEN